MAYVPFELVKQTVPIQQGADWLKLKYKKEGEILRGQCVHGGDARSLVITPAKHCFYCFACNAGGSVIDLVSHIKGTPQQGMPLKDAATLLMREFVGQPQKPADTVQEPQTRTEESPKSSVAPANAKFDPQKVLARLDYAHEAVKQIGDPDTCRKLGIGVDPKGFLRGYIGIPVTVDGEIAGFLAAPIGTIFKVPEWKF